MARRPAPFTQADVKRLVAGVLAVNLVVKEVVATADMIRVIIAGEPDANSANPWDER